MTAYTNETVYQRKRQLCIWGKTFHITAPHSRNPRAVSDTSTLRAVFGWRPTTCTIFAKKHYLPLVAKGGTLPTTLPPALAGVRLLAEVGSFVFSYSYNLYP